MTLRTARAHNETCETNDREKAWWNEHAELIAKVWEMHRDVSWKVRAGYLRRAREFFLRGRGSATVLELGCGSGWVGQFIAGPELRIIGTDFSVSQIALASRNAAARGLGAFCRYTVTDSVKLSGDIKSADGVLIHAFMHHLDSAEIDELLENLSANLLPGARIWLYEPAFYRATPICTPALRGASRIVLQGAIRLVTWLSSLYRQHALLDEGTLARFLALQNEASERGWYLSPKEIPFDVDEFSVALAGKFKVSQSYWATVYLVGWVFETNLLKHDLLRRIFASLVVPALRFADERIAMADDYLRGGLVAPNHAFRVWECEVR